MSHEFEANSVRMAKTVAVFLVFNLVASAFASLQPLAVPVFFAQFCLLAVWSAWGPGEFWRRTGLCLAIGGVCFLTQINFWIAALSAVENPSVIVIAVQGLFSAWVVAQVPLWTLRYVWQWRITDDPSVVSPPLSENDRMIGIAMVCFALGSCRWATDYMIDHYAPFGYEKSISFYGWALFEFYVLIGFAATGTWLSFRLRDFATTLIPMLLFGIGIALVSAWLWFPTEEQWITSSVFWLGAILFSWSVVLPMRRARAIGYRLYQGSV